jgi:hypothetical protein
MVVSLNTSAYPDKYNGLQYPSWQILRKALSEIGRRNFTNSYLWQRVRAPKFGLTCMQHMMQATSEKAYSPKC